jgi:hypothetical protein
MISFGLFLVWFIAENPRGIAIVHRGTLLHVPYTLYFSPNKIFFLIRYNFMFLLEPVRDVYHALLWT